jgi:hypothetical protein
MIRLAAIVAAGLLGNAVLAAQVTPYALKMETQPGVVIVTFTTEDGEARVYLPDDLSPGENFSGTVEATHNFVIEFGDGSVEARRGAFRFTVPQVASDEFVPLILRNLRGRELARASISLTTEKEPGREGFRVPELVQAGRFFPIFGPFDGDTDSTTLSIDGRAVPVLAESRHKAVARVPDAIIGAVGYRIAKKGVEKQGEIRSLAIAASEPAAARAGGSPIFDLSIRGLAGLKEDVPLRVAQNYFYLAPSAVAADGTFTVSRAFDGIAPGTKSITATLVIPQTPAEEVAVILRTPQRSRTVSLPAQHAEAMTHLDFDAMPLLEGFITDYDLGSDAAYTMLALNESRALTLLFRSMPKSGPNIERLVLAWFLDHYDFVFGSANSTEGHEAAVRLLDGPVRAGTVTTDLALYVLGLTGSENDFPLLEKYFNTNSRLSGTKGTNDAAEAALARLGSRKHLEMIRAELEPPLSKNPPLPEGVKLGQALDKAGYTGSEDLLPEVCSHLTDPFVLEIDIGMDPAQHAMTAMSAIVEKRNPRRGPTGSLPDWLDFCQFSVPR